MLRSILQFFRDIGHDMAVAVQWVFSPDSWRIILIVIANLAMLVALGYAAVVNYDYSREVFARCPSTRNIVFISEFFTFTFFCLFSLAGVGEMLNWVDAKRRGDPRRSLGSFLVYGTLAAACGTAALLLIIGCS